MPPQPNCSERLPEHLRSRIADFRALEALGQVDGVSDLDDAARAAAVAVDIEIPEDFGDDDERVREAASERTYEYPLAVSTYRTWRIDLSTGGPGDWFEVTTDDEGDVTAIRYHFADWFDHAEQRLEGDQLEAAEAFARQVTADFYVDSDR